jgi:hypothetical protein
VQDDSWSWVGEDGVEHHGSESQLTAALSAQRIAAYTLVTRARWRDWLPAMSVGELQWALPVDARDVVRAPTPLHNHPKLPPPLEDFPALKLRLKALQASTPTPVPSRPRSALSSSPHLELSRYANDDFDEPTVQIDAEELERALNESRSQDVAPYTPRSGVQAEIPRPGEGGPLAPHEVKRRALAQRLAHKMPTYPALVIDPSVTPSVPPVAPLPSRPSAPVPAPPPSSPSAASAPDAASHASAPSHPSAVSLASALMPPSPPRAVSAPATPPPITARYNDPPRPPEPTHQGETSPFAPNEPTLTSRLEEPSHRGSKPRRGWLIAVGLLGTLAGALWFATQRGEDAESSIQSIPLPSSTVSLPAPAREPAPVVLPHCSVDKSIQVSDFAHAQVRPSVLPLTNPPRLAVGFAQSGRIASGVTVDVSSLTVTRLYSDNQTSPLWSVTPTLVGENVKFRASRAASTLRSTVSLPTTPPVYLGLNREGIALRGDSDLVDRLLWKTEWDTISTPDVAALESNVASVTFRAGGERGKLLIGNVSAQGGVGDLQAIDTGAWRIEPPALLVTDKRVLVTYVAGERTTRDRLFVASSERPALPSVGKEILRVEQGLYAPSLAPTNATAFAAQYTVGAAGRQHVAVVGLDAELNPYGEPLVVSPSGRDAYDGLVVSHDQTVLSFYFVRQEYGHELWLSRLKCE